MPAPANLPGATRRVRVGGSFAPPLDDAKLASFETIASAAPPAVGKQMSALIKMLQTFRQTPASTLTGRPHPSGRGTIVPLEDQEIRRIWDLVPWLNEKERLEHGELGDIDCDQINVLFDQLPVGGFRDGDVFKVTDQAAFDTRNAAYHLLWFARELALDREPITNDRL